MKILDKLFRRKPRREWHPCDTRIETLRRLRARYPRVEMLGDPDLTLPSSAVLLVSPEALHNDSYRPTLSTAFLVYLHHEWWCRPRRYLSLSRAEWIHASYEHIQRNHPDLHLRPLLVTNCEPGLPLRFADTVNVQEWTPDEVVAAIQEGIARA